MVAVVTNYPKHQLSKPLMVKDIEAIRYRNFEEKTLRSMQELAM